MKKIGDIIYPFNNPDSKWWRKSFWDVLIIIKDNGNYTKYQRFYNYEGAIIYSELVKLKSKVEEKA